MNAVFRLVWRSQLTRGRLIGLGALGALMVLLGVAVRFDEESVPDGAMYDVLDGLGLAVIAPVVALVIASAALGDLAEDKTLVYVWLRPIPRWQLAAGALGASLAAALPLALVPTIAATMAAGAGGEVLAGGVVATALATTGYGALFLGLGLRVRRALVWGLAYLLIWEGAVARAAEGAARLSVQMYARSLLAEIADHTPPRQATTADVAIIVLVALAVAAAAMTTRWLRTTEVA